MRTLLIFIIAAVVFAVLSLTISLHVEEDAFIYYRYGLNSVRGVGLVFNPGEHIEGFSSPLWMVLLVLVAKLGFNLPLAAPLLGILFGILTIITATSLAKNLRLGPFEALAYSLSMAICYPFILWSHSGLETPLYTFLLTLFAAVYLNIQYPIKNQHQSLVFRQFIGGALIALVTLARPEGILLIIPVCIDRLQTRDWRGLKRYLLPWMLIYGIFLVYRFITFGSLTPNTSVKIHPTNIGHSASQIFRYFCYLGGIVIIIPFLTFSLRQKFYNQRDYSCLLFLIMIILVVSIIFTIAVGGDYRPFFRFLTPSTPLLLVVFWKSYELIVIKSGRIWSRCPKLLIRFITLAIILGFSVVSIGKIGTQHSYFNIVFGNEPLIYPQSFHQLATRWIVDNVPKGSTVAYGQMGQAPYYALQSGKEICFIDTLGLMDRRIGRLYRWDNMIETFLRKLISIGSIPRAVGAGRREIAIRASRYLLERRPDFIIIETVFKERIWVKTLLSAMDFVSQYTLIARIPQKESPLFLVYRRNKLPLNNS